MNKPIKVNVQTPKITLQAKAGLEIIQYGTLTVGETTTLAAGENATVLNSGTIENAVLNFGIPKGHDGTNGKDGLNGIDGTDGTAATIAIGTVTTGEPGSSAAIVNSGTTTAAVFDITIPRGDKGADGAGAGDVIAAADNTFTATNTFDGVLKTKSDMQAVGSLPSILQRSDANIQTYTLKDNLSRTVSFGDEGDMVGYVKTFIISIIRAGGTGAFYIDTENSIGNKFPAVYYMDGALPDIAKGECLKIAMEVNEPANAIFIYILGKVSL